MKVFLSNRALRLVRENEHGHTPHIHLQTDPRDSLPQRIPHSDTRAGEAVYSYLSVYSCRSIYTKLCMYLGMCIIEAVKSESREDAGSLLSLSESSFSSSLPYWGMTGTLGEDSVLAKKSTRGEEKEDERRKGERESCKTRARQANA